MSYSLIREAIVRRQAVSARYQGHRREMCPHAIGTKRGRPQVLFYQFGGGSARGLAAAGTAGNWRCIPLSGLSEIQVYDAEWHTAPRVHAQTCIDEIDIEIV
jgi:hypothetical protein